MKVLDITEFYSERGGGVRSHLSNKSQVSCQLGLQHIVVAPGPRDEDIDLTRASNANGANGLPASRKNAYGSARLVRFSGPSLPYDPTYHLMWRLDKIRHRIERERPDVLGIHSPYAAALAGLSVPRRAFGVRVFTWHADFIDTYLRVALERHTPPRLASALLEPLWGGVRRIARGCDATFVAARWQRDKLLSHGVPRVVQVPFGIERGTFVPEGRSAEVRRALVGEGREARAGEPGWKLLVGVGRFAVEKRWDVVIDAFLALRANTRAVLVLFGDGPERAAMEARVRGRDDVRFAGFVRDRGELARALASADALVHGCPYETFGLSIAEAMSAGLPVVVPDEGGAAEMVEAGGGATYASLDAEACARAVLRVLARDPAEARGEALAVAARVPDVTEQFARTFEAYRRLLDEAHGAGRCSRSDAPDVAVTS
jgi:alpha-1,6-mannosyltransferase